MRQVLAVVVALGVVVSASPRAQVGGTVVGRDVSRDAEAGQHRSHDEALEREAASRRIGLRQGQCAVAARAVQGVRVGRADRDVRRAVSDARASACSSSSRPRDSRPSSRSRRWRRIRPRARRPSNCPATTRTRSTATSRRRSCTSTTAGRRTTTSWKSSASPCAAPSSSRGTARRGAASSPRSRASTAPSAASSIRIRETTVTSASRRFRTARCGRRTARSAAA